MQTKGIQSNQALNRKYENIYCTKSKVEISFKNALSYKVGHEIFLASKFRAYYDYLNNVN